MSFGSEVQDEAPAPKPAATREITTNEINPDFARMIKDAREAKSLTREQFAQGIGEKVAVIERVERGMRPEDALRRRIERALGVSLGYSEEKFTNERRRREDYTLGDAANIRVRKRKPEA